MRQASILFLLVIAFGQLWGQGSVQSDSTGRVVQMNEVVLAVKRQTLKDQLVHFFRANQSSTLEEIMSRLPELSMIRRGSYGMEPTVRSFSSGQINLLVDGMKIHGACTDKMDPPTIYIEPSNLDNLSVQSTAQGIAKGSAIGGTINMQLQQPLFGTLRATTGSISSGYQSAAGSLFESIKINHYAGKWAFLSTATFRKAREYTSGGHSRVPFSQYSKVNYAISALHKINENTSLKIDLLGDDGWNIGYPSLPMDVGYAAARIISSTLYYKNPEKRWKEIQFKVYANAVRHFMDDTHRPAVLMHMDMPGKSTTAGFYGETNYRPRKKTTIQIRFDGSQTRLHASMTMYQPGQLPMFMLTWPDNSNTQLGGSLSLTQRTSNKQEIVFTSRIDAVKYRLTTIAAKDHMAILNFQQDGRLFLLKNIAVSLVNQLSSKLKTIAAISYAERAPTSSELFGFYLYNALDGYDHMGNPFLKKERAFQTEWSINYTTSTFRTQTTLFATRLSQQIQPIGNRLFSPMTIGAPGVKQYQNIQSAFKTGIESVITAAFSKQWILVNSFRYWYGVKQGGTPLPYFSPLRNVASVKKLFGNKFIQLESEYAGAQKRIDPDFGEDVTPAYLLWHLRCQSGFSLKKIQIQLQAGIENLLDKKYHDHLDWNNVFRPGRNGYLLVNVRF